MRRRLRCEDRRDDARGARVAGGPRDRRPGRGAAPPLVTTGVAGWYDNQVPGSPLRLRPTVALDGTHGVLVGGALLSGSEVGAPYRGARLAGGWLLGPRWHLPIELKVRAFHRGGPDDPEQGLVRTEARLHFAGPKGGAWMAMAKEQPYGFAGQLAQPLIGLGAWARHDGLSVMFDLEQRAGLLPRASRQDSSRARHAIRRDAIGAAGGHARRPHLHARHRALGSRAARRSNRWAG